MVVMQLILILVYNTTGETCMNDGGDATDTNAGDTDDNTIVETCTNDGGDDDTSTNGGETRMNNDTSNGDEARTIDDRDNNEVEMDLDTSSVKSQTSIRSTIVEEIKDAMYVIDGISEKFGLFMAPRCKCQLVAISICLK